MFGKMFGGDGDDPFDDIDRVFEEFFSRGMQGIDGNGRVYTYTWNSSDPHNSGAWLSSPDGQQRIGGAPADPDNIFYLAAIGDEAGLRRLLTKNRSPNERHPLGWTAAHVAAFHGQSGVLRLLKELGADVKLGDDFSSVMNLAEELGRQPAQIARERQSSFGAQLPANYDFKGTTPLHYAVLGGSQSTVQTLLELGADPLTCNADGKTPLHFAKAIKTVPHLVPLLSAAVKTAKEARAAKEAEERRKYPLEARLKKVLVAQDAAIQSVSSAVRRKENGWYDDDHPLVLLFLGSSGVGKTELAKQVACYLHKDDPKAFIRIDMSEFQQQHEVSKFIGSPPGYIGHDEGGQLTAALRERPEAVVLFDEVEKAHPDILTILLQLFDEGRLTDGKGKTIECKRALFVMTSNLAAREIADRAALLRRENRGSEEVMSVEFKEGVVQPILRRTLRRDEFLGRINEMVYFLPFSEESLRSLVRKELETWRERAERRHGMQLEWEPEVVAVLARGFNPSYGARSIKHEVETKVVNKLSKAHEREELRPGNCVRLQLKNGHISLHISEGTKQGFSLSNLPASIIQQFQSKA